MTTSQVYVFFIHGERTMNEHSYVRRCPTPGCDPEPFSFGVRVCQECGQPRPLTSAFMILFGGSGHAREQVQDALEAVFNSRSFLGRVTGRLDWIAAGAWEIKEATLHRSAGLFTSETSGREEVTAALEAAGLTVVTVGVTSAETPPAV
jgi:hypothetical protein